MAISIVTEDDVIVVSVDFDDKTTFVPLDLNDTARTIATEQVRRNEDRRSGLASFIVGVVEARTNQTQWVTK